MALSEQTIIGHIGITASGNVEVREDYQILKDGEVVSTTYHRYVLSPGDDLAGKPAEVVAHANVAFTPEKVAAKAAQKAAEKAQIK